jgi:hypothetical protein
MNSYKEVFTMKSPYGNLSDHRHKLYFFISLVFTLSLMIILNIAGAPMVTEAAPYGIVSFELSGSITGSQAILASWDEGARLSAAFNLGLDYLFMPVYAFTISLACLWAGKVLSLRGWPLDFAAVPLAWGQWLAAGLDAIENLGLTLVLFRGPAFPWPQLAALCASIKFALIILGILYAVTALLAALSTRPSHDK